MSGVTAASSSSGSTRPTPSTPTTVTEPPKAAAKVADDWRTAECSTAGEHDVRGAAGIDGPAHRAPRGGGDRLGGPAGEHDLAGAGTQQGGHLLAGLLEGDP